MNGERRVGPCRTIVPGSASGPLLKSSDGVCFYTINPTSGVVAEKGHPLLGRSVAGTVLVFPNGKGSSVVQLDGLYQLVKHNVSPVALIVESLDTVLVSCAVIMNIPLVTEVDRGFFEALRDGTLVEVNADAGTVAVVRQAPDSQEIRQGAMPDQRRMDERP